MNINMAILVDAKKEYTIQLKNMLKPSIYKYFDNIINNLRGKDILKQFQEQLIEVPSWSNSILEKRTSDIAENYDVELIDELLTAIFISNVRILTAIKTQNVSDDINIKIPELSNFIHKCYHESAKEIYKNPYIFLKNNLSSRKIQENMRITLDLIDMSIDNAIRLLLPLKQILNTYVNNSLDIIDSDDEETVTEENEPVEEETVTEENEPVEEETVTEENEPVEEETVTEENEPVEEETVTEENEPVEEETVTEENEPVLEETVTEENEPVEEETEDNNSDRYISTNMSETVMNDIFNVVKEEKKKITKNKNKNKLKKGIFYKRTKKTNKEEHSFF